MNAGCKMEIYHLKWHIRCLTSNDIENENKEKEKLVGEVASIELRL